MSFLQPLLKFLQSQCQYFSQYTRWHQDCPVELKTWTMRKLMRIFKRDKEGWAQVDNPFLIW